MSTILTIPNILTFMRMGLIPVFVSLVYYGYSKWALAVFLIAGISDGIDGFLARKFKQESELGTIIDPIADKLVVAAILMAMTAHGQIAGWVVLPALIILCREILVSGLREYLAELKVRLPVSMLA